MKLLVIETSSRRGSVALIENGRATAERSWTEDFRDRRRLFAAIEELVPDWEADAPEGFVVGRGPGAFSGIRIAFSVVSALAAPDGRPAYALNGGAAIAKALGAARTTVVGDARRGKLWVGNFIGTTLDGPYRLVDPREWPHVVPEGAVVASPDRDRLAEMPDVFPGALPEPVFPSAKDLGEVAAAMLSAGVPLEPFEPLYLHPPVFVEPRFPAE